MSPWGPASCGPFLQRGGGTGASCADTAWPVNIVQDTRRETREGLTTGTAPGGSVALFKSLPFCPAPSCLQDT